MHPHPWGMHLTAWTFSLSSVFFMLGDIVIQGVVSSKDQLRLLMNRICTVWGFAISNRISSSLDAQRPIWPIFYQQSLWRNLIKLVLSTCIRTYADMLTHVWHMPYPQGGKPCRLCHSLNSNTAHGISKSVNVKRWHTYRCISQNPTRRISAFLLEHSCDLYTSMYVSDLASFAFSTASIEITQCASTNIPFQ